MKVLTDGESERLKNPEIVESVEPRCGCGCGKTIFEINQKIRDDDVKFKSDLFGYGGLMSLGAVIGTILLINFVI